MKNIYIGTVIHDDHQNYTILNEIGNGGFAVVYKAEGGDGNLYAVKVIQTSSINKLRSFYNEYNIASQIDSAHVIKYYYLNEHGKDDFPCFIIMEYADRGSLRTVLNERKSKGEFFSTSDLKKIFLQLIEGMLDVNDEAVHRDIKPENILLCSSNLDTDNKTFEVDDVVFKISDYGIAKFEGEDTRIVTFKGIKTPRYYAPELWLSPDAHGLNTIKIDIYAMGIVFYELANLCYPYDETKNPKEAHTSEHWKPFNKSVDVALKTIISKMLEKSPSDRYEDWMEIKEYLENSNIGLGIQKSGIAESILNSISVKEEANGRKALEKEKKQTEKERAFKLLISSVESKIYYQLQAIVDDVNRDKPNTVSISKPEIDLQIETYSFEYRIGTRYIRFEFEALHDEAPKRSYSFYTSVNGRPIDDFTQRMIGGVPNRPFEYKYYKDKILLWGSAVADSNIGYNIAILEDKTNPYGKIVMYEYIKNGQSNKFSFPVDRENLKKIINGRYDPYYSFKKIPFDFDKIAFLIKTIDVFSVNSIDSPMDGELGIW